MRKKGWIILTSLVVILVIAVIGGKMYMDNKENKEIEKERKIAIQAKDMFRDVKALNIHKGSEASPGSLNFDVDILQIDNTKFTVTLFLGDKSSFSTDGGTDIIKHRGNTETSVIVKFSNNHEETIK